MINNFSLRMRCNLAENFDPQAFRRKKSWVVISIASATAKNLSETGKNNWRKDYNRILKEKFLGQTKNFLKKEKYFNSNNQPHMKIYKEKFYILVARDSNAVVLLENAPRSSRK